MPIHVYLDHDMRTFLVVGIEDGRFLFNYLGSERLIYFCFSRQGMPTICGQAISREEATRGRSFPMDHLRVRVILLLLLSWW